MSKKVMPTPSSRPQHALAEYGTSNGLSKYNRVARAPVPLRFVHFWNS